MEFFIAPILVNHRRYEAPQAFWVGRPDPRPSRRQVQIDTRWVMVNRKLRDEYAWNLAPNPLRGSPR